MLDTELAEKFRAMAESSSELQDGFKALTRAHSYFQGAGRLKSVSVSDVLDNGTIEATFHGVRIAFAMVPVFGANRAPRGRVIVMNCHCVYGQPVQEVLGSFSYGADGQTDLDPDHEGRFPLMHKHGADIVMRYLDAAFTANRTL